MRARALWCDAMHCAQCTAEMPEDDVFCENCGGRLRPEEAAQGCSCGAPVEEADQDGYCLRCGLRVVRPPEDHMEQALSPDCAAVTDRGLTHARNEDRFAMERFGDRYALVVCDGVSSAYRSDLAAATVTEIVVGQLASASPAEAIAAAQQKLDAEPRGRASDNPPSTTAVAALVSGARITVAWVGDSRAYWIGGSQAIQLTRDHSWVNAVVANGEMSAEQALRSPQAHGITRWLGADAGENAVADETAFDASESGVLLLCTDGLWNYASSPADIAGLVDGAGREAIGIARALVQFANDRGGHDNITALALRLDPERDKGELNG